MGREDGLKDGGDEEIGGHLRFLDDFDFGFGSCRASSSFIEEATSKGGLRAGTGPDEFSRDEMRAAICCMYASIEAGDGVETAGLGADGSEEPDLDSDLLTGGGFTAGPETDAQLAGTGKRATRATTVCFTVASSSRIAA